MGDSEISVRTDFFVLVYLSYRRAGAGGCSSETLRWKRCFISGICWACTSVEARTSFARKEWSR